MSRKLLKLYQVWHFSITSLNGQDMFPSVSFCFGFKPSLANHEIMSMRNIENWKQNQTLKTMNETFRKATFDLSEVLVEMISGRNGNYTHKLNYEIGNQRRFENITEVLEVYSEQGRSYSIYHNAPIATETAVIITLNITR